MTPYTLYNLDTLYLHMHYKALALFSSALNRTTSIQRECMLSYNRSSCTMEEEQREINSRELEAKTTHSVMGHVCSVNRSNR